MDILTFLHQHIPMQSKTTVIKWKIVRKFMYKAQGRIQEIEFGGVQAVFAGADAGLGIRAHKPR